MSLRELMDAALILAAAGVGWWMGNYWRGLDVAELRRRIEALERERDEAEAEAEREAFRLARKADELAAHCRRKDDELHRWRGMVKEARPHLQALLSEVKEAKAEGRPVSGSRIRREVKKVMRWFYEQQP